MAYREAIERAGLPVIFDYDIYVEKCWGPTYRGFLPIMGVPEIVLKKFMMLRNYIMKKI